MRKAGQSTRKMARKRRSVSFAYLFIALGLAAILVLLGLTYNSSVSSISGFGLLGIIFVIRIFGSLLEKRADHLFKLEDRAVRGARAEEKIEDILAELGENFFILHDVESPYGNIDHAVLSRYQGIFLLETKAHGGRVEVFEDRLLVNGKPPEKDFVAQALRNTYWLKQELKEEFDVDVWVTPIIVFTNAFVPPSKPIKNVRIVNAKFLAQSLHQGRSNAVNARLWELREELQELLE